MIQVTRAKIKQVTLTQKDDGSIDIQGTYQLFTDKGDVIAKTSFNGYETMKIEFSQNFCQNVIDNAELTIEAKLGIQTTKPSNPNQVPF